MKKWILLLLVLCMLPLTAPAESPVPEGFGSGEAPADGPAEETAESPSPEPAEPPEESVPVKIRTAEQAEPLKLTFTPTTGSPYDGRDPTLNYWTLAMRIEDEEAVWQALTAPMTVVDNGKGERAQIVLREKPDPESRGLGSITCSTQGVHVLERGKEWSLVECYSASFHDSPILNWNALVQGYVPTEYLREIVPNQTLGLVIDKLTQRLYVFQEGRLYSTLMVSTGLSNAKQPYNETRSGEFLLTSKVGTFRSDNLLCGMAIRFDRGDLLHEVPRVEYEDGTTNYRGEPRLHPGPAEGDAGGRKHGMDLEPPEEQFPDAPDDLGGLAGKTDRHSLRRDSAVLQSRPGGILSRQGDLPEHPGRAEAEELCLRPAGGKAIFPAETLRALRTGASQGGD